MNFKTFIFFLLLPFFAIANPKLNEPTQFANVEDSLKNIAITMFKGADQEKINSNKKFIDLLKKTLALEGAFEYPFDSLKFIAKLSSPDKVIRIFNWNIPKNDGSYMYYGFLLVDQTKLDSKNKSTSSKFKLYELTDKSAEIKNPELAVLAPDKWFGALYYKIILTNDKGKKFYTLLGWDGNTNMTWKKIIEVLTFGKDGSPIFGEKYLFERDKKTAKRIVFEFRADLTMTLKYEDDKKRIVFDHLAPEMPGAEGLYQFYSQTFSYDCYNWKKGKWKIEEDIDARNNKNKKDNFYNKPEGDQSPAK